MAIEAIADPQDEARAASQRGNVQNGGHGEIPFAFRDRHDGRRARRRTQQRADGHGRGQECERKSRQEAGSLPFADPQVS
jgi:hypothetical protein